MYPGYSGSSFHLISVHKLFFFCSVEMYTSRFGFPIYSFSPIFAVRKMVKSVTFN